MELLSYSRKSKKIKGLFVQLLERGQLESLLMALIQIIGVLMYNLMLNNLQLFIF